MLRVFVACGREMCQKWSGTTLLSQDRRAVCAGLAAVNGVSPEKMVM